MFPLSKPEIYGIALLALGIAASAAGAYFHHQGYIDGRKDVQVQFDAYRNEVNAASLSAEKEKTRMEKIYEDRVASADAGRNSALAGLRAAQAAASSGRSASASNPVAPSGSKQVCFDAPAYTAAFQQFGKQLDGFIQGARGLIVEGDSAQIDAQTILNAWPKASK